MGNGSSAGKGVYVAGTGEKSTSGKDDTFKMQEFSIDVPLETNSAIVNHYMPSTFPVQVRIDKEGLKKVHASWSLIMDGSADGMKGHVGEKSGIVLFYDEFFFRLFKRARVFMDIFSDPGLRGEILMKALGLMLRLSGDGNQTETEKLFYLGRNHRYKSQVRPWMFSVYMTTCLETVMFWLGGDADMEVGEAWTCLAAYLIRRILMSYLPEMVVPNEFYQNYDIDAVRKILTQSNQSKISCMSSHQDSQAGSEFGGMASS